MRLLITLNHKCGNAEFSDYIHLPIKKGEDPQKVINNHYAPVYECSDIAGIIRACKWGQIVEFFITDGVIRSSKRIEMLGDMYYLYNEVDSSEEELTEEEVLERFRGSKVFIANDNDTIEFIDGAVSSIDYGDYGTEIEGWIVLGDDEVKQHLFNIFNGGV